MNKKILIIVPCFNEEQNIVDVINTLKITTIDNCEIEILPINDASSDKTLKKITQATNHYLNLVNNLGIGGAVQSGLKYAKLNKFDFAIQLDGDGQHPPEELHKLVTVALQTNADLCIGSRYLTNDGFQSTGMRQFGIRFLSFLIYLCTKKKIKDCTSGFRLYNKKAIQLFCKYYPDKYPEPESIVLALLNNLNVMETPVIMKERKGGVSSIAGFSTLYYMTKVSLAILFLKLNFILKSK
jgi:glycosyltransferase involved in cell wall biosynthesis